MKENLIIGNGITFTYQGVLHKIIKVDRINNRVDIQELDGDFKNEVQKNVNISNLYRQLRDEKKEALK